MPTATYIPLATITLSSTDSQIDFANIPNTYKDLILICSSQPSTGNKNLLMRVNSDSGSNYTGVFMSGDGSSTASSVSADTNRVQLDSRAYGNTSNTHLHLIQFMDYSATDKHKTILTRASAAGLGVDAFASRWASTSAITSISIFYDAASVASGSTFSLYGIAG